MREGRMDGRMDVRTGGRTDVLTDIRSETNIPPQQLRCVWGIITFVPKCTIDNNPALIQIMVWHWPDNKHYLNQWWPALLMHICLTWPQSVNSLASERWCSNSKSMIFKPIKQIGNLGTCSEIALRWMPQTSITRSPYSFRVRLGVWKPILTWLISPYGITRQQWVKLLCDSSVCIISHKTCT